MAAASETIQTIARLTPLADVLAMVDLDVKPVTPRTVELTAAAGRTLAVDAMAPARPSAALALLDGWALAADATLGAGGYAPALLPQTPQRIEVGQPMPPGTDSVAPFDAVKIGGRAEALTVINPGDGVLPAGGDCDPAIPLRRAGEPSARHRPGRLRRRRHRAHHGARAAHSRVAVARQRHHQRRRAPGGERHRTPRRLGAAGRRRPRSRRRAGARKAPTPSSSSAAPAAAATTTACRCWRARAGSPCTASR